MTAFPKYERYKDSGVEWLGEVPEHWEVDALRACAELSTERNRPDLPVLSVYREYGVIPKDSRDDNHNATSLDTSNYKVVRPGDLAVNKMKAWQGSLGVSEHHGIVSPAYITCRVNQEKVNGRYLHYLLRSKPLIGALDSLSYGVRVGQWDMRFEDFKQIRLTYPPKPEQDRIVAFLDRKTAEIDALIAKKQCQIELLDEQKAILINRAVTRGLNPNAKLKPSGSKWIGQIPTHWETGRLKHHCIKIVDCPHATPIYDPDGEHPAIRTADVTPGHINLNGAKRLSKADFSRWTERMVPRFGDILYSREGERFGIAAPVPPDSDLCISQRMMAFRPSGDVVSQFLMWQLNCRHVYLQACQDVTGSAAPHVNIGTIANYQLVLPPMEEQEEIGAIISDLDRKNRSTAKMIESQIESLKTLRSTLIAHAVTGRIKV